MYHPSWQPSATLETLKKRDQILRHIRTFFNQKDYLEVETPAMARFGVTDVYLSNLQTIFRKQSYYLQTSPEYHMKRLLAAGSGPIFQLARVFRDDELGRWHNPEFTMLEWYQLNLDHHQLMLEVDELLQVILNCPPMIKKTYRQVFIDYCQLDPFKACLEDLQQVLVRHDLSGILPRDETDYDQYLFLLLSHLIEPAMAQEASPVAIFDFPPSQAALAVVNQGVAERFEVYYQGVELANGFHELTAVHQQIQRFEADITKRRSRNLAIPEPDEYLVQAMMHGLPACSGVAMGVDRLIALALCQPSIRDVMAFDFSRA